MSNPDKCRSCLIRKRKEKIEGGFIPLGKYWMVNHYQAKKDRFLGWLVLQPIAHRMTSAEMSVMELKDFGISIDRYQIGTTKCSYGYDNYRYHCGRNNSQFRCPQFDLIKR